MKVVLMLMLWSGALAAGDHGVTARFVPGQVRPGEVFELRVEMEREEYGQFSLRVPPHGSLHRVAVESEPVQLEGGVYRQRESWMLQADRSGEIVLEGMVVTLATGREELPAELPPLRMEVLPWGAVDESAVPVAFPVSEPEGSAEHGSWWWLVLVVVVVGGLLVGWLRRPAGGTTGEDPGSVARLGEALGDLEDGTLRSVALEQLLVERGGAWSGALREVVEEAVYAGRGDARSVAVMLRKEVGG